MTSLSNTTLTVIATILMLIVFFVVTRARRKGRLPVEDAETWESIAKENERRAAELHARHKRETQKFADAQSREADIRRLAEMERKARESSNIDRQFLGDIERLRQRLKATEPREDQQ